MVTQDANAPELLGVEVRSYKNLADTWLPWSDGIALFGANGAGKTNLLECLALLMGSAETLRLAHPRTQEPSPGALALIARVPPEEMPVAPEACSAMIEMGSDALAEDFPGMWERVSTDHAWWQLLGAKGGGSLADGLASAGVPAVVIDLVLRASLSPVVRFALDAVDTNPDGSAVKRRFARQLLVADVSDEVAALADTLPDIFGPLRTALAGATGSAPWTPLLELPEASRAPATLQWLARARTSTEAGEALRDAFATAATPAERFVNILGERVPLVSPPEERDWHWWLHEYAQRIARDELGLSLTNVSITATGADDADFAVIAERGDEPSELSHTLEGNSLDPLSSGERRWVDEAMATMARELLRIGERVDLHTFLIGGLTDDVIVAAVEDVATQADATVIEGGFWTGQTFELVLQALDPRLAEIGRQWLAEDDTAIARARSRDMWPGLEQYVPSLVVRIVDEPEAHLHPAAQRRVAAALDSLRLRGQNIVIASHSPHFLDLQGWSLVHVENVHGTTTLRPVPDEGERARASLARDLGVNRGELLAGIAGVLIVEGPHDRLVLDALFGSAIREAGIAVICMYGTGNLMATAELDFITRYLDVPVAVLLDYTRLDRVQEGRARTDEERKLAEVWRTCRRRRLRWTPLGLDRPDIVCYLSESAVRDVNPGFPGWSAVLQRFEARRTRPPFKSWMLEEFGTDLTHSGHIKTVLDAMRANSHAPVGELTRKVSEVLALFGSEPAREGL